MRDGGGAALWLGVLAVLGVAGALAYRQTLQKKQAAGGGGGGKIVEDGIYSSSGGGSDVP